MQAIVDGLGSVEQASLFFGRLSSSQVRLHFLEKLLKSLNRVHAQCKTPTNSKSKLSAELSALIGDDHDALQASTLQAWKSTL